jgi:hypothetical protein
MCPGGSPGRTGCAKLTIVSTAATETEARDAGPGTSALETIAGWLQGGSGSTVAVTYHRTLAAMFAIAWLSLASQVIVLIGDHGLLPLNEYVSRHQLSWQRFPSIFINGASDTTLMVGAGIGFALSVIGLFGIYPRVCMALNTALYLSYVHAGQDFFLFQWDSLLIECGFLAVLLPTDRPLSAVHLAFRLLLFKLYFESGVAKWKSPIHDWSEGVAMVHYYETAPLPTWLGYWAHQAPDWWHYLESRLVLVLELVVPFLIFGPRRARLIAAALLTGFQLVNLATANYGFFVYLALGLHLFLLDDDDLRRAAGWLRRRLPRALAEIDGSFWPSRWIPTPRLGVVGRIGRKLIGPVVGLYVLLCAVEGVALFGKVHSLDQPLRRHYAAYRVVNNYHLFAAITVDRFEPTFETFDGARWTEHDLRYKPGDPEDAPGWVAPHQPRVDFQLWFYGLNFVYGPPRYVRNLRDRLCFRPGAVQRLFRDPLPRAPVAVRIAIYRYRMTSPGERSESGAYWHRERLRTVAYRQCRLAVRAPTP